MRIRLAAAVALAVAVPLSVVACGGGGGSDDGKIVIGTKFDQPGLGLKNPDGTMSGFDVDVATYVAKELGFAPDKIEWKESPSAQRETLIQNDQVKFIAATYSINDKRREKVDFAGPYFTAHQDLLVRADDATITKAEDLNNKKLCSVTGSTSAQNVKEKLAPKASVLELDGYSECVVALQDGLVDAMTTDNAILAGYAAQKGNTGKFRLVGLSLSSESYGIGIKKGNQDLHAKINAALKKMVQDGSWDAAVKKNFGQANFKHEPAPQVTSASS